MNLNNETETIKVNNLDKILYFLVYSSLFLLTYIFIYMLNSRGLEFNLLGVAIIVFFSSLAGIIKTELIKRKRLFSKQIKFTIILFLITLILIVFRDKYILWQILIFFKAIFIYNESNLIYKTIKNSANYLTYDHSDSAGEPSNKISRLKDNLLKSVSTGFFSSLGNNQPDSAKKLTNKLDRLKGNWIKRVKLGFLFNNGLAIGYYLMATNNVKPTIMLLLAINFIVQLVFVALFNYQLKLLNWKKKKYIISKMLLKKIVSITLILVMLISAVAFFIPSGPEVSSLKVVADKFSSFNVEPGGRGFEAGDFGSSDRPSLEAEDENIENKEEDISIFDGIFGIGTIMYFIFFAVIILVILMMLFKPEVIKTFKLFASFKKVKFKIDKSTIKTKLCNLIKVITVSIKNLLSKSRDEINNDSKNNKRKSKLEIKSEKTREVSKEKQQLMNDLLQFLNLLAENGLSRADSQTINEFFDKLNDNFENQQGLKILKEIASKSFYSHLDISEKEKIKIEGIIESLESELNLV